MLDHPNVILRQDEHEAHLLFKLGLLDKETARMYSGFRVVFTHASACFVRDDTWLVNSGSKMFNLLGKEAREPFLLIILLRDDAAILVALLRPEL